MLKKILIGIMIVLILVGSVAFYAYKKIESQFESFIMTEVERQQAALAKTLEEQFEAAALKAANDAELIEKENEIIRRNDIIRLYFADIRENSLNEEQTEIISMIPALSSEETAVEEIESKPSDSAIEKSNDVSNDVKVDLTQTSNATKVSNRQVEVVVDNAEEVESVKVEPEEVIETVQTKAEVEAVYTVEDFEKDKDIAMELALSRLTASQLSKLIDLSAGGFSPEDKKEAKEMFYSNFTASEQAWILDIYTKYYILMSEG